MQKIEINKSLVGVIHGGKALIDNANFDKLDITGRGQVVGVLAAAQATPIFHENLSFLTSYKNIVAKLLKGEDCSVELAFNNIEKPAGFDDAVAAYQAAANPLVNALLALEPKYQWIETRPRSGTSNIYYDTREIRRNGYRASIRFAELVWKRASRYWANNPKSGSTTGRPGEFTEDTETNSGRRTVQVNAKSVTIGCQNITRWEMEQIAKHYGWQPAASD